MKKYSISITAMLQHIADKSNRNQEFTSYIEAKQYFITLCDQLGYEYGYGNPVIDEPEMEAGGIGYDYRVELTIE